MIPDPAGTPEGTTEGETPAGTSIEVELPVTWSEDGKAEAYVTFELNDEVIEPHHPQESFHSGKHTLSLYYPIDKVVPEYTNTFNVYLRMTNGTGNIDTGDCIASVSGQAMAAAPVWDGKITIEEKTGAFHIGGGLKVKDWNEVIKIETMELVIRNYSDQMAGRTALGAFCRPVELG